MSDIGQRAGCPLRWRLAHGLVCFVVLLAGLSWPWLGWLAPAVAMCGWALAGDGTGGRRAHAAAAAWVCAVLLAGCLTVSVLAR